MFNTRNVTYESKVVSVPKETIIEKSISPDKVTEMYDKIKWEITWVYLPKWNSFELVALEINNLPNSFWKEVFISFRLNWNQNDIKLEIKNGFEKDKLHIIDELRKSIAEAFTDMLLQEVIRKDFF